jgi:hypothetical protein
MTTFLAFLLVCMIVAWFLRGIQSNSTLGDLAAALMSGIGIILFWLFVVLVMVVIWLWVLCVIIF